MPTKRSKNMPDAISASGTLSHGSFPDDPPRSVDELPTTGDLGDDQTMAAASSLASDVKDTARSVKRVVREQVGKLTSDIGHELGKTAEDQKTRGVAAMQAFARAVNAAADELGSDSPLVARYARDAAHRVEGLSGNISGRKVSELIDSAAGLARSRPGLFFAGVVFAGFALSRFMKSSAGHDFPERGQA